LSLTDPELADHLKTREESLLDPAVRRDPARVAALLAEDFQEIGSSGRVWTREQILDLLASEPTQTLSMEDFECRRIAEGVALVCYRSVRIDPDTHERVTALRSSLWTEKSSQWHLRFHQGTRVP
jgi:ribonuclease HI